MAHDTKNRKITTRPGAGSRHSMPAGCLFPFLYTHLSILLVFPGALYCGAGYRASRWGDSAGARHLSGIPRKVEEGQVVLVSSNSCYYRAGTSGLPFYKPLFGL
ncbi:hypothetical protein ES703_107634 [subsurface metagenome]